jgi:hypothetical protein
MTFYYDNYGWLTATPNGRETDIIPPQEDTVNKANFVGTHWVLMPYTAPIIDTRPQQRAAIQAQLDANDRLTDTPRARREAALGITTYLASIDAKQVALRTELAALE